LVTSNRSAVKFAPIRASAVGVGLLRQLPIREIRDPSSSLAVAQPMPETAR